MACVYILFSQISNKFYTGSTRENVAIIRLKSHNNGKTKSTKSGKPWIIIREEQYNNYTIARKRELFLKSGIGREWINKMFLNFKERCQSGRMGRSCPPTADPPLAEKPQ